VAAGDLTTFAALSGYVNVGLSQAETEFANRLISGASNYFRQRTGRDIQVPAAAYSAEKHSGDGNFGIHTKQYPVTELLSANGVYVDGVLVPQAVNPGDSGWVLVDAETGRIELVGHLFEVGVGNVSLTYKAGYAAIPADLEQAIIEHVALRYADRKRTGIDSMSAAGESAQFGNAGSLAYIVGVLDTYRDLGFGP